MTTTADILEARNLAKSFNGNAVLEDIDLRLRPGSITAVVGSSGCGKTTLLRLIAGFETPDAGTVTIAGRQVASPESAVAPHRRGVGYVAQDGALFPHLTVGQNIAYGLPGTARSARVRARVAELLETVSLDASYASRRPHQLSGGQQQRVALARALARQPVLMLLDEPFSALDTGLRASTRKAVAQLLADAGVTTLLVTHDQEEALSIADQVAVMRDGRFTQVGTPATGIPATQRPLHRRVPRRLRLVAVHSRVGDRRMRARPHTRADARGRRARHADAAARTACRDGGFGQRRRARRGNRDRHRVPRTRRAVDHRPGR